VAIYRNLRQAERGEQTYIEWAQALTPRYYGIAICNIFTAVANIFVYARHMGERDASFIHENIFLHNHTVGTRRNGCARGDTHTGTCGYFSVKRMSSKRSAD